MDNLVYIAMTGAKNTLIAQSSNANNLANANTWGFKEDLDYFASKPVYGPGHPSRAFAEDERAGFNPDAGSLIQTGRTLDVGVGGEGYMVVQTPEGVDGYSRRGDLRIDPNGLLVNGEGNMIMGNGGPIAVPPHESMVIGRDGTISIRPLGGGAAELVTLDRILLVNPTPDELVKGEDGLLHMADGSQAEPDAFVQVVSGTLESSNVNTVEAMVNMIEYARGFEAQSKFFKVAEKNDEASSRLMRLG